jgi:hypothetical protein
MGKGKRIREERNGAGAPEQALDRLLEVETKDQFFALVADRPAM